MSRARCMLQAEENLFQYLQSRGAGSPKNKPPLPWAEGHFPVAACYPYRDGITGSPVIAFSPSLFSGTGLNAGSALCCFSASLLSFISQAFADLLCISCYPLVSQLMLLLMYQGFLRIESVCFYSPAHQSCIL